MLHSITGVVLEVSTLAAAVGILVPLDTPVAACRFSAPLNILPAFSIVPNASYLVVDKECLKSSDAKSVVISFSLCPRGCNCSWKKSC